MAASGLRSRQTRSRAKDRAIERRALWAAEDAARELPNLPLEDALQLVHLYAERGSPKYEKAAMRWLERYLTESSPRLQHFAERSTTPEAECSHAPRARRPDFPISESARFFTNEPRTTPSRLPADASARGPSQWGPPGEEP